MPTSIDLSLTQNQFEEMSEELSGDLTAFFNLLQDDILGMLDRSVKENWTPEKLMKEIEDLI